MDLWGHQKEAAQRAAFKNYFALFFEMGTGKTRTALEILREKIKQAKRPLKTLIVSPLVVVPNWVREADQWIGLEAVALQGSQKKRVQTFLHSLSSGKHTFSLNYEGLLMKDLFLRLRLWAPDVLIFDESHKLKSHNSQRTKKAFELSQTTQYRYLLSGTPVLNSAMDLFSQYLVMDHGDTFGKNFHAFKYRYFYDANAKMPSHIHFPNWQIKKDAVSRINKALKEDSMRVTKEECLDLPPLVRETRYVEMSPEQKRMYEEMKKDFITFLQGEAVVAQLALTKALRLQQIVSGFAKTAEGKEETLQSNPREAAMKELLEELCPSHKVIVWAVFKHNFKQIKSICDKLKLKSVEVHGGVSAKAKQEAIESFTREDDTRVYIGHPGAGGIGINLTIAPYCIYYSRDFSLEHDVQSESRNHRGGSEQHTKVTRIDLVCKETIDEIVLKMLANKNEMGEELLKELRRKL